MPPGRSSSKAGCSRIERKALPPSAIRALKPTPPATHSVCLCVGKRQSSRNSSIAAFLNKQLGYLLSRAPSHLIVRIPPSALTPTAVSPQRLPARFCASQSRAAIPSVSALLNRVSHPSAGESLGLVVDSDIAGLRSDLLQRRKAGAPVDFTGPLSRPGRRIVV